MFIVATLIRLLLLPPINLRLFYYGIIYQKGLIFLGETVFFYGISFRSNGYGRGDRTSLEM